MTGFDVVILSVGALLALCALASLAALAIGHRGERFQIAIAFVTIALVIAGLLVGVVKQCSDPQEQATEVRR